MFENFINELKEKARELGIDGDSLINTYEKWYQLGLDAGLDEEEIVRRFGSIDQILQPKEKNEESIQEYSALEISVGSSVDLIVEKGNSASIEFDDEEDMQYFDVINDGKKICLKEKNHKSITGLSDITIRIPENSFFKDIEMNLVSGNLEVDMDLSYENMNISAVSTDISMNGLAKGKATKISNVSGDVEIEKLVTLTMDISTVSGDFNIEQSAIKKLEVSTISGDVDISGNVEQVDTSSISGEVTINHQSQKTSLKDVLGRAFKF